MQFDENRGGSCISLAVTKNYKVVHSPRVKKRKKNHNKKKSNKTSIQLVPKHSSKVKALPCHKEGEKTIKRKKYAHVIVRKISYVVIRKGRPQYQKWLRKIC